jgi:7-keto-8-aminopelargonate synthetase-like enzyme
MAHVEDLLQAVDEAITFGVRRDMMHNVAEDERLDGRRISINGRSLTNFGSCSYLGLEMHPALKAGVADAVDRYGTQFSSSRAYVSAPAYAAAEELLSGLFARPALITSSTTLGHMAALPTLLGARDVLLMDHQVHHSVQTAAKLAQVQGTTVSLVPHNDMAALERRIGTLRKTHERIWYAADGLYSMYADFAPTAELERLLARYEQLWLYVDDAHSVSWTGRHGRGHALARLGPDALRRTVVAGSLNKSFAAAGGVLTFPDAELRRRVFTVGGPLIFSGPVQPPMLGAVIASARLHMSDEVAGRQARLLDLIRLFNRLAADRGLPLVSTSEAPIRCIGAGAQPVAYNLTGRLRTAGYFTDSAVFPAVSPKRCGARITLTTHHTEDDVAGIVDELADALPRALADEDSSVERLREAFARQLAGQSVELVPPGRRPAARRARLVVERHDSITTVDRAEWDAMFGGRGAMEWTGLRTFEQVFAAGRPAAHAPEDSWRFDYLLVRDQDRGGRPVAATFFTNALWKDDMLSSAELSAEVERLRADDPYHLTSRLVAMGSLLTEGDHLYLDRTADWRAALRLLLTTARAIEEETDASGVTLRDLPDGDAELHDFLVAEGFARVPVPTSWVREVDFRTDEEFLASLTSRPRHHQRTKVLALEDAYKVTISSGGGERIPAAELDHLYRLYRNVHSRNLELNVFPLPRRVLDAIADNPGWEIVTLRLLDGPDEPVAFVVQHVGPRHVQPLFLGLDYDYVASHGAYQQALWQSVRSAQRLGVDQVLFGMAADRQKARFGARPQRQWAYVQSADTYNSDILDQLARKLSLSG